jgi:aryl-alcohol dehydrogenase-like predicted oxidoreductase
MNLELWHAIRSAWHRRRWQSELSRERERERASERGAGVAAAAGTIAIGGDVVVNRLGFGAMRITGKGIFGPPADRAEAIRVLRRAVELGVEFIDTADSYGPHVSEELIAEALHPYPSNLVIATKAGFQRPGPSLWTMHGKPRYLRAQLYSSLRRLKLERIDLWQLHRVDPKVPADEQFGVLADAVREGLVRHVGLSEVSVAQIEQARRVVPIASVQNKYNPVERRWDDVLAYCEHEHIAFIPWHPLGAGTLVRGDQATTSHLEAIAATRGVSVNQIAIAWLLARSPAMLPIPGTSRVSHLEENVEAARLQLSPSEMD